MGRMWREGVAKLATVGSVGSARALVGGSMVILSNGGDATVAVGIGRVTAGARVWGRKSAKGKHDRMAQDLWRLRITDLALLPNGAHVLRGSFLAVDHRQAVCSSIVQSVGCWKRPRSFFLALFLRCLDAAGVVPEPWC